MTGQNVGRWWKGVGVGGGILIQQGPSRNNNVTCAKETLLCVDIDPTAPITQVNWTFISV